MKHASPKRPRSPSNPSSSIVITLTANPALDLSGTVQSIVPNEKNSVRDERRDPGGNGINAARVAGRLGARVMALGFTGGSTGDEFEALLDHEGIPHRFTRIVGTTRTNVTVSVEATHQQTRLSFPGPRVTAAEQGRLLAELERTAKRHPGSILLLGGSLPLGMDTRFWKRCLSVARHSGCEAAIDIPARAMTELFPARVRTARVAGGSPLFLKPNAHELAEWAGISPGAALPELARAAAGLVRASGAAFVLVSMGAEGAILANTESACRLRAPRIQAKGTVGAGDSTVGALAAALLRARFHARAPLERALQAWLESGSPQASPKLFQAFRLALAAGAATAEQAGTALARPARIRALAREVTLADPLPKVLTPGALWQKDSL